MGVTEQLSRLREAIGSQFALREVAFQPDGDRQVVKGVLLLRAGPGNPHDRHWYSEACIHDAATSGIFEGTQCYLNHPSTFEEQTLPERSVKELAGWYSDVRAATYTDPQLGETVGLYADFHPAIGRDDVISLVRTCADFASRYPRMAYAGLSINAVGPSVPDMIDGEQWNVVDKIEAVESVDIVTRAGAGGTLVPLKESWFGMKGKTKTKQREAKDVKLTIDADAVREGTKSLLEGAKGKVKEFLKKLGESGVQLSDDQDKELDSALGISDGGAIDKVIDDATGVDESEDGGEATTEGGDGTDIEADIEAMPDDPKFLKTQLRKERAGRKAAEAKASDAEESALESQRRASSVTRERLVDEAVSELNIPDDFRPGCKRYVMRENFTTKKQVIDLVKEFDVTYIRRQDGAGVVGNQARESVAAKGGNFTFEEGA